MKRKFFEKINAKKHEPYVMQETEEPEWLWDLKVEKKNLRRTMSAASDDEITIKAASTIAKQYHTTRAKILAQLTPSNNIAGSQTWDKDGKVFRESFNRRKRLVEDDQFEGPIDTQTYDTTDYEDMFDELCNIFDMMHATELEYIESLNGIYGVYKTGRGTPDVTIREIQLGRNCYNLIIELWNTSKTAYKVFEDICKTVEELAIR